MLQPFGYEPPEMRCPSARLAKIHRLRCVCPCRCLRSGLVRFVRRLHSYYGEVRLLASVHHRLRLLTFPMRATVLTPHATAAARHETSHFRYDPFARDVALDPGRATALRIAVPHMLPSSE